MTATSSLRRIIDRFDLAEQEVAIFQCEGDAFDLVRLAYTDDLEGELGRVVGLSSTRPLLATALAVWTPATRIEVVETVQVRWRHFELEVIG